MSDGGSRAPFRSLPGRRTGPPCCSESGPLRSGRRLVAVTPGPLRSRQEPGRSCRSSGQASPERSGSERSAAAFPRPAGARAPPAGRPPSPRSGPGSGRRVPCSAARERASRCSPRGRGRACSSRAPRHGGPSSRGRGRSCQEQGFLIRIGNPGTTPVRVPLIRWIRVLADGPLRAAEPAQAFASDALSPSACARQIASSEAA